MRGRAGSALAAGIACACLGSAARAHGGGEPELRPVLAALPPALAGMRIELRDTLGWQLVLENPTPRTVEVLDGAGVPFLRIGPRGVEANLAAPALYRTLGPASAVPEGVAPRGAPRWQRTSADPSAGWFDPRLAPSAPPHAHAEGPHGFEVPLRVGGERVALRGRFESEPPPAGRFAARLTGPSDPVPGVRVTLLPGRVPGLLVRNESGRPLLVLGIEGEPFLRIGPSGVDANLASPTWRRSARSASTPGAVSTAASGTAWQRVSPVPRFAWVDPRAVAKAPADATRSAGPLEWSVPMQLGDTRLHVTGVVSWQPLGSEVAHARPR